MSITQIRFRKRRAAIAAVLFVLGAVVYLTQSGAPLRVHLITVPTELALAAVATYFLGVMSISPWRRLVGMIVGLTCVSLITTWLSSKVIAALTPLDGWYFVMDLGATFLKATLLIGAVWLIDFVIELVVSRIRKRHQSMLAVIVVPLLLIGARCITVPAVVEEPQVISRGELVSPAELREHGVGDLVRIEMNVGTDGVPRNAEERRGIVRWLRPEFQNPSGAAASSQTAIALEETAPAGEAVDKELPAWPKELRDQVSAVRDLFTASGRDHSS